LSNAHSINLPLITVTPTSKANGFPNMTHRQNKLDLSALPMRSDILRKVKGESFISWHFILHFSEGCPRGIGRQASGLCSMLSFSEAAANIPGMCKRPYSHVAGAGARKKHERNVVGLRIMNKGTANHE
jgi:hypothetical protein